jgi:hypothetical protein
MKLFCRVFGHRWTGTIVNRWMIEIEQRCRCGSVRHHLFEDIRPLGVEQKWRDGPHPGAGAKTGPAP